MLIQRFSHYGISYWALICENGRTPDQTAAKVLFELANEGDEHYEKFLVDDDYEFEALAPSFEKLFSVATPKQTSTSIANGENKKSGSHYVGGK